MNWPHEAVRIVDLQASESEAALPQVLKSLWEKATCSMVKEEEAT